MRDDVEEEKYTALAAQPQFDCVGKVRYSKDEHSSSCVLITSKWILSAAHVFDRSSKAADYTFTFKGQTYTAKQIILDPQYSIDEYTLGIDMALIELTQEIENIIPAKLYTGNKELNTKAVGVGYGASGIAYPPDKITRSDKKVAGENMIDSLGGKFDKGSGEYSLLMADFDHPKNTACNKMGSATPLPLEYMPTGGDSGGGLFIKKGDQWLLVGICKGWGVNVTELLKTGYYGQLYSWSRVTLRAQWIEQIIKQQ